MAWDKGFDFRATSGYVTDPTNCTYVLASDTYPVTRNDVTFGWTVAPTDGRDRHAYTGDEAALAGIVFGNANGTFRVDLPATGSYAIRLAMGDQGSEQTGMQITVYDNVSSVFVIAGDTVGAHWIDASDVDRTSATDWVANNVAVTKTFTTTTFTLTLDAATSNTCIATLFISQVTSGTKLVLIPGR